MRLFRRRRKGDLLELEDVERRLQPLARRSLGLRPIPLEQVVGTHGRAAAFMRDFEPRHGFSRDRPRSLAEALSDGGVDTVAADVAAERRSSLEGRR